MNITSIIAKATRKIHSLAVGLHVRGLRATVNGAHTRYKRATSSMLKAAAVAEIAYEQHGEAINTANMAKQSLDLTRMAAITEAKQIGGVL